jgi:4-hydroxybenzoate polyprenyltransferase
VTSDLVGLLRPDHWFKNVFALPGVVAAMALFPHDWRAGEVLWRAVVGGVALCLTASANYVLNGILDAESDRSHPTKGDRPLPAARLSRRAAWLLYVATTAAGLGVASALGVRVAATLAALWLMGIAYNVPPVRTKDVTYLDVLSESANNPIRLLAGWWIVLPAAPLAPGSLVLAYWTGGGFLMALKRFGELRFIGDRAVAVKYRRSFAGYDETRLLASVLFYAATASAFLAAFVVRYRLELLLSLPFAIGVMTVWFVSAFRDDSPVQRPERLWREPLIVASVALFAIVATVLLFVDLPFLSHWLSPGAPSLVQ